MTTVPKGTRVLHVKRGNLELVFPIHDAAARNLQVSELAMVIVRTMQREQVMSPGRASEPIIDSPTPLALRLVGRDSPLDPARPLLAQTEGKWTFKDLPVQGQSDATARLPVCEFDLIDLAPERVIVAG